MEKKDTFTIIDNRTEKSYEIPLVNGHIRAMDLRQIKTDPAEFGTMSYDPAFVNTASCKSAVTYLDGLNGILRYRGYPIEQVAEQCGFLEAAYLVINGELPTQAQLDEWVQNVISRMGVHENIKKLMDGFQYDAHPMGMFISGIAALSTYYPEAKNVRDAEQRKLDIYRLIGKVATIAAWSYRHSTGQPYVYPETSLGYTENFMNMLWKKAGSEYKIHPVLARALEVLFILHIDHTQNCSTNTMRGVGSSEADPYVSTAAAAAALSGPLHGGANERVLRMLAEIGSKDRIPEYIDRVKRREYLLMGFGHRVYKNYDPRARIIKKTAEEVFEVTGKNPALDIALELERIALEDDYFVQRKLYPNVDFYSGIIYQAMGFDPKMFTVLFAIPRTVGWLAQWQEMLTDKEQKISRPRQIYVGREKRDVVPIDQRTA